MTNPAPPSETIHASCIAIEGRAILISGRSGSGKSDLALRLIDRGATLVSDDYTVVQPVGGKLMASAPATIEGWLEVRGIAILPFDTASNVPICLHIDLERNVERLPPDQLFSIIAGVSIPCIAIKAFESSAPIKVEAALRHFGLVP